MENGKQKRPRDSNQLAKLVVGIATGEERGAPMLCENPESKARKAGKAGGDARAKSLSPERRSEIAEHAANTRWSRKP